MLFRKCAAAATAVCMAMLSWQTSPFPVPEVLAAEGETNALHLSIDQKELTWEQLQECNYQVPVYVRLEGEGALNSIEFGIRYDESCSLELVTSAVQSYQTAGELLSIEMTGAVSRTTPGLAWMTWASGNSRNDLSNLILLNFTIPETAQPGDQFEIQYLDQNNNSFQVWQDVRSGTNYITDDAFSYTDGYIHIRPSEEETTATTTTTEVTTTIETTTSTTVTTAAETEASTTIETTASTAMSTTAEAETTAAVIADEKESLHLSIDSKQLTMDELAAMQYTVPLYVRLQGSASLNAIEFGLQADERCDVEIVSSAEQAYQSSGELLSINMNSAVSSKRKGLLWLAWASNQARNNLENLALLLVTVPQTAQPGDSYTLQYLPNSPENSDSVSLWQNVQNNRDYLAENLFTAENGTIQILSEAETTPAETTTTATETSVVSTSVQTETTQTVTTEVETGTVHLSIDQKILSVEELRALNYTVPVYVRLEETAPLNAIEFGIQADDRCTYEVISSAEKAFQSGGEFLDMEASYSIAKTDPSISWITWASAAPRDNLQRLVLLMVHLPENAAGNTYPIRYLEQGISKSDNTISDALWQNTRSETNYITNQAFQYTDGFIQILAPETITTEATTTTTSTTATETTTSTTSTSTTETTTTTATTSTAEMTTTSTTTSTSAMDVMTETVPTTAAATTESISTTEPLETVPTTETTENAETADVLAVSETEIALASGSQYIISANQENLSYVSNQPEIATVSPIGVVTALRNGTATISVLNEQYESVQIVITVYMLGDVDISNEIDAADASEVLQIAAVIGAGKTPSISEAKRSAADVNKDGNIDADDASIILIYAAIIGAKPTDLKIEDLA